LVITRSALAILAAVEPGAAIAPSDVREPTKFDGEVLVLPLRNGHYEVLVDSIAKGDDGEDHGVRCCLRPTEA
jgi:hypothetical protein